MIHNLRNQIKDLKDDLSGVVQSRDGDTEALETLRNSVDQYKSHGNKMSGILRGIKEWCEDNPDKTARELLIKVKQSAFS